MADDDTKRTPKATPRTRRARGAASTPETPAAAEPATTPTTPAPATRRPRRTKAAEPAAASSKPKAPTKPKAPAARATRAPATAAAAAAAAPARVAPAAAPTEATAPPAPRRSARSLMPPTGQPPDVSVVIPVYNEEGILSASIHDLMQKLRASTKLDGLSFEIILSANGCRDRTIEIAGELMTQYDELRLLDSDEPNYGRALRMGIKQARGTYVVCDEIDLCDVDFYERALYRLREEDYDMVVGSKRLERSFDKRPPMRRFATSVINWMLWLATGFEGTDTHGLKAFRRERVLSVVDRCVVDRDMFASELVIRTGRQGLRVTEIPLEVIEKRAPSVNLVKRVPRVLRQLATLTWVIRFNRT